LSDDGAPESQKSLRLFIAAVAGVVLVASIQATLQRTALAVGLKVRVRT
jgi:hypothetical protein